MDFARTRRLRPMTGLVMLTVCSRGTPLKKRAAERLFPAFGRLSAETIIGSAPIVAVQLSRQLGSALVGGVERRKTTALVPLVGENLAEGDARMVVDGDVRELPRGLARLRVSPGWTGRSGCR